MSLIQHYIGPITLLHLLGLRHRRYTNFSAWQFERLLLGAVLRRRRSASALGFLPTQVLQRIVETALRPCKIVVSLQMPGDKFIRLTG